MEGVLASNTLEHFSGSFSHCSGFDIASLSVLCSFLATSGLTLCYPFWLWSRNLLESELASDFVLDAAEQYTYREAINHVKRRYFNNTPEEK